MNYDLGVEQKMLKESARNFFTKEMNSALIREWEEDAKGYCPKIWKKMAQVGWMGLALPEAYEGAEGSFLDLSVVLEEMGYAGYLGPFFATVVLGASLLHKAASPEQKETLLPDLAMGKRLVTLAYGGAAEPEGPADLPLRAVESEGGFLLNGTSLFVPYAHIADTLICAARMEAGQDVRLFLVDRKSQGVSVEVLPTMADDKLCEVVFDQVRLGPEALLPEGGQGWQVLQEVLLEAAVAKCAEMVGGARRVLKIVVDYAKNREQFGRPIGSFQAIQHHCANMLTYLDTSALMTHQACSLLAEGQPFATEVAMCKSWVGEACRKLIALGHQVMGGFGFMEEVDLQIYHRRTKAAEQAYGDGTHHRERIASLIGL